MTREIPLTRGPVALVDDDDYAELSRYTWHCHSGYARRTRCVGEESFGRDKTDGHFVLMHRQIMRAPLGLDVDHIDGSRLNNQRDNLRICTGFQNTQNRKPSIGRDLIGVVFSGNPNKPYRGKIRYAGKTYESGTFATREDAARAYDEMALRLRGEFARLNFPSPSYGQASATRARDAGAA